MECQIYSNPNHYEQYINTDQHPQQMTYKHFVCVQKGVNNATAFFFCKGNRCQELINLLLPKASFCSKTIVYSSYTISHFLFIPSDISFEWVVWLLNWGNMQFIPIALWNPAWKRTTPQIWGNMFHVQWKNPGTLMEIFGKLYYRETLDYS